ncbi:hypothetical protein BZA77DRAFT_330773 [Pyronema omphalodes]|nr:hypothetical protein BZA77DRAFT_330773 [Pyronema omphalodes]
MADQYPMAEGIGTDLRPDTTTMGTCQLVDDAMLEWTFKDVSFRLVQYCAVPGGYVELCEYGITANCDDGTMKPDNGMKIYADYLREAMSKMGRPAPKLQSMKLLLEEAGFEDVHAMEAKEPFGPWPKDPRQKRIGAMSLLNCETGIESYGMAAFTRVLGMDVEKARAICDAGLAAVRNKNYHMYAKYYRVYGRKPEHELSDV